MENQNNKKEPTLETLNNRLDEIEMHLKRQDTNAEKSDWLAPIGFAGTIIVAGIIMLLPARDIGILIYGVLYAAFTITMYFVSFKKAK